jgi:hypothetical protein
MIGDSERTSRAARAAGVLPLGCVTPGMIRRATAQAFDGRRRESRARSRLRSLRSYCHDAREPLPSQRKTGETEITATLVLDGAGRAEIHDRDRLSRSPAHCARQAQPL